MEIVMLLIAAHCQDNLCLLSFKLSYAILVLIYYLLSLSASMENTLWLKQAISFRSYSYLCPVHVIQCHVFFLNCEVWSNYRQLSVGLINTHAEPTSGSRTEANNYTYVCNSVFYV